MEQSKDKRCYTCKFSCIDGKNVICRFNPPQIVPTNIDQRGGRVSLSKQWPEMKYWDWCGQWSKGEDKGPEIDARNKRSDEQYERDLRNGA